ncbi:hypothetical protein MBLNU230_g7306t1 [Neophaeotheca triangularis]
MAPIPKPQPTSAALLEHSLSTSAAELKYERSTNQVSLITKDEDIRRLRFDIHTIEDDNDELRDLLAQEEDRSDAFEKLVNENLARAEEAEAQLQAIENGLRGKEQELTTLQAEAVALKHTTADATAALTEKLALTRELSVLKPELEHLKAQAASTEALMTEKLALQRQLSEVQCEVENAKRDTKRALAKRRNTGVEIAQEEQVEELRRQLAKERRARQRAEEAAESVQGDGQIDDVRKELAREKRARQKAEEELEAAQENTQVEDVRKDLLKEKRAKQKLEESLETARMELEKERKAVAKAAKKADNESASDDQTEALRQELATSKKESTKAEKAAQKAFAEHEAQKSVLEDKLNQFRTKLKSTKEKLKETEAELFSARETAEAAASKPNKNASMPPPSLPAAAQQPANKKRKAPQLDPESTNLGTPGDAPAVKRGRKAAAGLGDKSTFSITPFLNKTVDVTGDDHDNHNTDNNPVASDDEDADVNEAEASPAAKKATAKQPLAQQPASNTNIQKPKKPAQQRKPKTKPALEMITEESQSQSQSRSQGDKENATTATNGGQTLKIKTKLTDGESHDSSAATEKSNNKKKPRKSLVDFKSFANEPEPVERHAQKTKKRKLGGLGKTLFDEEEEPATRGKGPLGGKGFVGYGAGVGGKKAGGSLLGGRSLLGVNGVGGGGGRSGVGASALLSAGDGSGFQFSPLKRSRKGLDDTLRG